MAAFAIIRMKEIPLYIQLHPEGSRCLYEQIYEHIRDQIRERKLLAGEKLPSARYLAQSLQVSRTTVDMAYGQLAAEGYLEARPKRGYFVCEIETLYEIRTDSLSDVYSADDLSAYSYKVSESSFRFDFSPNTIDMSLFPYATWKRISKNILVDAKSSMFALGEPQGDLELRTTICRYLYGARGVDCKPEQIIIGAGNDYLLLLLEKILGRHVPIAMENPTYMRAYRMFRSFAWNVKLLPMDENGMSVETLRESHAKAAYVMPAHQYPTGIIMPIARRMELLKWAGEESDRYLIEDDYDSEFRYRGRPIPSLQASDKHGCVVYIGTFSKAIAPAIRISYMVLPMSLLNKYKENCGYYASTVSRIDQAILNEFIAGGYFERYLNRMRQHYRNKHDLLLRGLHDFEKDFAVSGENAGLHLVLTDLKDREEKTLVEAAMAQGVKVYPLGDFIAGETKEKDSGRMQGKKYPATIILGYGALSEEEISKALEALKKAW